MILESISCCFSCPYFRNEIGGETEKQVALTRETGRGWGVVGEEGGTDSRPRLPCHTPRQARGFCLLEHNSTHWKVSQKLFQRVWMKTYPI